MFNSIVFMARYSSSLVLPFDLPGGNVYARKLSSSGIHFFLCILILTRNLTKKCEKECVDIDRGSMAPTFMQQSTTVSV
jgi:hypothetical protein